MYILIANHERAGGMGDGKKSLHGKKGGELSRTRASPETKPTRSRRLEPSLRAKEGGAGKTSSDRTHLGLVDAIRVPIRCRQLMHEVHPDLFAAPRPMQRQGRDLGVSIILLVIRVMHFL